MHNPKYSSSIQEDEWLNARIRSKTHCNLTLPALLNKVPKASKNLSENIVLAHLNRRLSQASK
jgi:hypothetical protein